MIYAVCLFVFLLVDLFVSFQQFLHSHCGQRLLVGNSRSIMIAMDRGPWTISGGGRKESPKTVKPPNYFRNAVTDLRQRKGKISGRFKNSTSIVLQQCQNSNFSKEWF